MSDLGNKKIFSRNLQKYMYENNIDRNEICKALGFKYSTFADWFNGNAYPRIDKIEKLASFFGIKKSDLIEDKSKTADIIQPKPIPVLGKISAGLPLFADEQLDGYMFAPENIVKEGFEYFYLRVNGDSMNVKFNDGDLVLIQKQNTLENGDIGAIRINGFDATIKRFKQQGNLVILEPMSTNPVHTVQIYNPKEIDVYIIGKAIWRTGKI